MFTCNHLTYVRFEAFKINKNIPFQMEQIDDFFEYFMRPWMASMYQETFDNLMNDINYFDVGKVLGFVSLFNRVSFKLR